MGVKTTRSDAVLGTPITGILTFVILTWAGSLPSDYVLKPYITDVTISITASLLGLFVTFIISYMRFFIGILTKYVAHIIKIKSCNSIINKNANISPEAKAKAQKAIDDLTLSSVNDIASTKIAE
ncbi:hypothetical protein C9I86_19480 [Photobacterium sp. NCIMB 13483]|nr:hypothetical protein C9I86_19480 [Photobacterium sp. NCIMB 13483]